MTTNTTTIHALSFKTERDLFIVNILSALLVAVIAFFPNSPLRILLGLLFILFFPGYVLICALFPRREDLDGVERLAWSTGLRLQIQLNRGDESNGKYAIDKNRYPEN